jgi:signal transduction histidine kinase
VSGSVEEMYGEQLRTLESDGYVRAWQTTFRRRDGTPIPALINLTRLDADDRADFMAIVVDLTERERIEEELRYRSEFESLVARTSARIVGTPTSELDEVIRTALAEIGNFHEVDRCSFFQAAPDLSAIGLTHHWFGDQESAEAVSLQHLPMSSFTWWRKRLEAGTTIHIADVGQLPESATAERDLLLGRGIRTLVAVPMMLGRQLRGFMTLVTVNRTKVWTSDALSSLRLLGDIVAHVLERQRLDEALREANQTLEERVEARTLQLEMSNKELASFSHSVSHDLRAPLRSIDGFSELLLAGEGARLSEAGRGLLERVRAATRRMGELIDALLQLSRLSRASVSWQRVDLTAMARRTCDELAAAFPERSVEVVIDDELSTYGEPALLAVVMENLINNAWKFTARHESARLEIGAERTPDEDVFFVRDDGAGFDPKFSKKLFGTFERLHQAHEFSGHGIGLATVARIIKLHGGEVWADGAVEGGAVLSFRIGHPPRGDD